jgi:alpha-glucoside transport system permease protein
MVVITIAMIWMLPSVGVLINSLRPPQAIKSNGWWTVFMTPFDFTQWTLENYATVLQTQGLAQSFRNSLIICIPATILPILIAAFAAYAFAWMEFPGRQLLFSIVVGLLVVPLQMTFVPVYALFTRLELTGTFVAIWLAHTGYGLPFAVYLLRNFFGSLPSDLFESAFLDGASYLTAFFYLALPLSIPSLASLAIFQFLWVWNDLLVALIYLGGTPSVAPLTVQVANLVNSLGADWHLLPAAAFIAMVLPLIVFLSLQQYFVRGILAGSVKGA